ncbi:TMV resistance protein N-like [Neltuma alba]|uniref:TMV resistance protein N-like n=1 Tax=Neltuma alba TaxID=207710 RepID=UPI0010A4460E|nr:TMV resistance protein N-like [Prosopis alba]
MSTSMQVKYDKYWGQADNMNPLLFVSVILDHRYKLAYVNHMFDLLYTDPEVCLIMNKRVKDCLYWLFNEYSAGVSIDSGTTSTSTAGATSLPSFDDDGGGGEEDPDSATPGAGGENLMAIGTKYEVFLSFSRGKETPESFPSRLYSSLCEAGISVFKDDVSIELLQSITETYKFSVIIFSKHYASSRMCPEELTKIMKFHKLYYHVVLPIFYEVGRSEVCNQESSLGEAFQGLIQRISPTDDEVSSWRRALTEARGKYGFDVPNLESK